MLKDSSIHIHGLAVYVKKGLFWHGLITYHLPLLTQCLLFPLSITFQGIIQKKSSSGNWMFPFVTFAKSALFAKSSVILMHFWVKLHKKCPFLKITKRCTEILNYTLPSSSFCMVFDSVSCNIDEVLLINLSAIVVSLETSISIIRTGFPILAELIDLVNSVTVLTLLRWLTFQLKSQAVILIVLLFWISFFLLTLVFVLQWLSLHSKIMIMLLYHFPLTFDQIHNRVPHFIT